MVGRGASEELGEAEQPQIIELLVCNVGGQLVLGPDVLGGHVVLGPAVRGFIRGDIFMGGPVTTACDCLCKSPVSY